MSSCYCTGPQNGEPLCPCRMKEVTIENGRYILKKDLGPIKTTHNKQSNVHSLVTGIHEWNFLLK